MTPREAAQMLADQATPTFPCRADKSPMTVNGFHDATLNHTEEMWRGAELVGMPTGKASGYDVIDIDPRHGGAAWLKANAHSFAGTYYNRTVSGGYHIYLRARSGMRCSVSRIAPGVDVRAEGGYVIRWDMAGFVSGTFKPECVR